MDGIEEVWTYEQSAKHLVLPRQKFLLFSYVQGISGSNSFAQEHFTLVENKIVVHVQSRIFQMNLYLLIYEKVFICKVLGSKTFF